MEGFSGLICSPCKPKWDVCRGALAANEISFWNLVAAKKKNEKKRDLSALCAWWKGKDENFAPSIGKEENCARDARHGEKERKKISRGEKESWARALTAFWAGLADCLLGNPTDAGGVNGNSYLRSNPACASFPWSSRHTQIRPQFLNGGSTLLYYFFTNLVLKISMSKWV